jgi:hypothetical protein
MDHVFVGFKDQNVRDFAVEEVRRFIKDTKNRLILSSQKECPEHTSHLLSLYIVIATSNLSHPFHYPFWVSTNYNRQK